jgi:hypothetical protein
LVLFNEPLHGEDHATQKHVGVHEVCIYVVLLIKERSGEVRKREERREGRRKVKGKILKNLINFSPTTISLNAVKI